MLDRDPIFHCVWADTPYVKHQLQLSTPLHRVGKRMPIAKEHHCQISREPNLALQGPTASFCAIRVIRLIALLGDQYHRISLINTIKLGVWLWY